MFELCLMCLAIHHELHYEQFIGGGALAPTLNLPLVCLMTSTLKLRFLENKV